MACDTCGKTGVPLVQLLDAYKTTDIGDVCHDCESVINKHLGKLRSVTHNILVDWMKRFMAGMRQKRQPVSEGEQHVDQ